MLACAGGRGHRTLGYLMKPDEPVLLKTLKDNGHFVWWGGCNDLAPGQGGFDAYCINGPSFAEVKAQLQERRLT